MIYEINHISVAKSNEAVILTVMSKILKIAQRSLKMGEIFRPP